MKFHKPKNIYEVVHPTQFIYKYHNLFPLTFIGHVKNGRLETTHWDILLFIFWFGLCSTLMILNMVSFSYEEIELSTKLLQTGDKIIVLIGVFMGILTNIYQLRKRENIKKFLRILNHFDDKVRFYKISI